MLYSSDGEACRAFQPHKAHGDLGYNEVKALLSSVCCEMCAFGIFDNVPSVEGPLCILVRGGLWYLKWWTNLQNPPTEGCSGKFYTDLALEWRDWRRNAFPKPLSIERLLWWISDFMPGVYILGEGDLVQTQGHAKASSRGHTHTVRITMTKSRHQNMIFGHMALESRCWWYSVCCMKLIKDMLVRCIRTGGSTQIHLTAWEHSCRSRNAWGGGSHHSQYINIWLRRHHHLLRTTQAVHIRLSHNIKWWWW